MLTERNFQPKKILVIGDIMLDRYYFGKVERISPEAPVPVLKESGTRMVPGGAANVAVNLAAAGQMVSVLSVLGKDEDGQALTVLLKEQGIDTSLLLFNGIMTTAKNRFVGQNNQQIFRFDKEDASEIGSELVEGLMLQFKQHVMEYDIVVLSDYGKGVCTGVFLQELFSYATLNKIRVIVDVKGRDALKYKGAFLLKPNLSELEQLTARQIQTREELKSAALWLCKTCNCEFVLVTCGERGMRLIDRNGSYVRILGTAKEVYDVTGAGDTALAYLAAAMANGFAMEQAVHIANCASGIQVSKVGTSPVYLDEVSQTLHESAEGKAAAKIIAFEKADRIHDLLGEKKIVFTNGCFDILHAGHVDYLRMAAALGDVLVIGVNSDASVRRLKGKTRPINPIEARVKLLAALEFVDYVVVFEQDTPAELISMIKPQILVKGADYSADEVAGKDIVEQYGGRVELIPLTAGFSTTSILKKITEEESVDAL